MIAVIILLVEFRIQAYLHPYKNNEYNQAETLAILSGSLTLMSGVVFTSNDGQNTSLNALILLFVVAFNISFISRWLYLLILCLSERYKVFKYMI